MDTKHPNDNGLDQKGSNSAEANQPNFTADQQVLKQAESKRAYKQNQQKVDGKGEGEKNEERKGLQFGQSGQANLMEEQKVLIKQDHEADQYKNDFLEEPPVLHHPNQEASTVSDREKLGALTVQNNGMRKENNKSSEQTDTKGSDKVDKYRVLKIQDGQIKRKLRIFKQELDNESKQSRRKNAELLSHESLNAKNYKSFDHRKVREANDFINKMQQKKKEDRRRLSENLQRKNREEEQRKLVEKEKKVAEEEEKRKRIEKGIEEKLKKRKLEEQQNHKKKLQIRQWSKSFKSEKPYHIRKQEEFAENQMISDIQKQKDKLFQLKLQRRPIDFGEIDQHEMQYMEKRKYQELKNQVSIEYEREQQRKFEKNQDHYYKGKYRYLILQELLDQKLKNEEDPKIAQRERKQRELLYGYQASERVLRKRYQKQSRTLEPPNEQFQQLRKRTRNTDGTTSLEVKNKNTASAKEEGNKNFYFMKNLVREKGIRVKMNQNQTLPEKLEEPVKAQKVKKLALVKNSPSRKYEDLQSPIKSARDLDSLVTMQRRLQEKLKRIALLKKHGGLDRKEDEEMEEDELNAVKMKLRLVRECD